jgi:hypothetical protein
MVAVGIGRQRRKRVLCDNGVDDYFAGKDSVTQIRWVFLTSDLIEFFYFNSLVGLGGPFRAVRMNNQTLASNPCRPHL